MKKKTTFFWVLLAVVAFGALSSGCSAVAPKGKPAGTATAIGAMENQVEKGNVEIEGDTDAAPPPP